MLDSVGTHTETGEEFVCYRDEDGRTWVRPLQMFNEVFDDGTHRFVFVKEVNDKVTEVKSVI